MENKPFPFSVCEQCCGFSDLQADLARKVEFLNNGSNGTNHFQEGQIYLSQAAGALQIFKCLKTHDCASGGPLCTNHTSFWEKIEYAAVKAYCDGEGNYIPETYAHKGWVGDIETKVGYVESVAYGARDRLNEQITEIERLRNLVNYGIDNHIERGELRVRLTEIAETYATKDELRLLVNADAVIEPVIEGVTERLVFNSVLDGIRYQVFAGETPFNAEPYDMSVSVVTARLGFEGDEISVKFFDDTGECVCTMKIEVISEINGFKPCRLREV